MAKARGILFFLFLAAGVVLNGQYTKEFKRIFFDADYLMETGFYEEAFNRYKNLLTLDPGNSNILFHCGACCLKIPGNEGMAITYLKEAAEGITLSYKEDSHKESGAPWLTYFMLGQAYHLNYQFSKAVSQYNEYLEVGTNQDPVQLEYARLQIEACERASLIRRTHPSFEFHDVLGHFEDDLPSCSNPVISGDGNTLIFLVDYPSDKKIMMTTRTDELWTRPEVINSQLGMVGETYPVSISYDGKDLYMVHQFYSHSDIFVSHLEENRWSEAEALGKRINGKTSETHASISMDEQSLYFTSDARGGYGSIDIYVSRLNEKGEWGNPENLGPLINTPYEEHTPFISNNDSILFFSSQGHASIGGVDVFHSRLQSDGAWSEPENLGYPVNTPGDNSFYNPGWDKDKGFYAVRREDDPTSNTINMVLELEYDETLAQVEPDSASEFTFPDETVDSITEAQLVEPPNTDNIEMVLNPYKIDTVVTPAFTSELITGIPFVTNKYELGLAAQLEVEKIAELMSYYPESKVELTGHADSIGSENSNILLSQHRAEKIAEYLEMRGVERDRVIVDGKGETEPLAINSFSDGSDATLGRYLNRHVLVRILGTLPINNHLSGLYVPVNLTPIEEMTPALAARQYHYTIQLKAARMSIPEPRFEDIGDFSEYICEDGYYRYTTNSFRTFQEARKRLLQLRKSGYPDAFIQTREWYEGAIETKLSSLDIPVNQLPQEDYTSSPENEYRYTIQLKAARKPILISSFQDVKVTEYRCNDGYYRYTISSFLPFQEAMKRLLILRKQGYPDAFLQTRELLDKAVK
jgi:outer membrane protein OmpA-like peptidoglycan-associated protein